MKHVNMLRRVAEERVNLSDVALKMTKEEMEKLKADLETAKKTVAEAQSTASKTFDNEEMSGIEKYVDKALKFENMGFKHCFKALAVAKVTLEMPIPFKQLEVEPFKSDPEDL
ncbi:hypothetical protein HYC85_012810 [Camellia sinensis]|uniref:Uncharacterized protein n=1 Tax=Camellia sinensis TaxID=4442 RepID=A0A7J7HE57_CAMSI|nr:hypothetical protein HYC85_012810 [Camellia sinensis]